MIKGASGWVMAPAYDLLNVAIILPNDMEELALTLDGKKKKLSKENFIRLGKGLDLTDKQIEGAFKRLVKNKPKAMEWIEKSFLSIDMKTAYIKILKSRYQQLSIV